MLAALATLGLGLVLGPEAPLIALGGGLAILGIRLVRRDAPEDVVSLMAAAGAFAAVSFIFESPIIAAVILIEATGIGGEKLPLVLVPGLLAAGVGSLMSIGLGSFTGLDSTTTRSRRWRCRPSTGRTSRTLPGRSRSPSRSPSASS